MENIETPHSGQYKMHTKLLHLLSSIGSFSQYPMSLGEFLQIIRSYLMTALIFAQSSLSNPDTAKLGFVGLEASPILMTTIFLLGMT